jgi:XTP/dITP diphosphohydrolase
LKIPKQILIATNCAGKLREIIAILGEVPHELLTPGEVGPLPTVVEDGLTFEQNACKKACEIAKRLSMAVLSDDSGIEVDALDGRPGVRSRRYQHENATDEENNLKLLAELEGVPEEQRTARYRCVVALATPKGLQFTADGVCHGFITMEPSGTNGFGYDPLFYYPACGLSFGMLDPAVKNEVSHRAGAVRKLRAMLLKTRRT